MQLIILPRPDHFFCQISLPFWTRLVVAVKNLLGYIIDQESEIGITGVSDMCLECSNFI